MTVAAFVGLGANLGEARATLSWAVEQLAALPSTTVTARSRFYRSAPLEADGPDYVNAVARIETALAALDLLHALQAIEHAAGRERPYWHAPRTLDLDLLLYGADCIASTELTVPHPRMWTRAFVLAPLREIAPERVSAAALAAVADQVCAPLGEDGADRV